MVNPSNKNIHFLSMDGVENDVDHDGVVGNSYPQVYFFARNEKDRQFQYFPKSAESDVNFRNFCFFIDTYSTYDIIWPNNFSMQQNAIEGKTQYLQI